MTDAVRREPFVSRELLWRVLLAWALVGAIAILRDTALIRDMRFGDPDDELRLTQVRDLIAGQGWFDLHQYRIDPPHGVLMHWSRLVDAPIAAVILLLRPLLGMAGAEQAAVLIVPLITLFAALLLAGRLAWKMFGARIASLVCMSWVLAYATTVQFNPLRIDHHGWQIVAVLAAANALVARSPRTGGWLAGGALAFGMSISLELLPFTGLLAGIFGLRWLVDRAERGWLVHMLQALAVTSIALFFATRGTADLVNHCDIIAPAYLAAFAAAALLVSGIAALPAMPRPALAAALGLAVLACIGLYFALAPQCTSGPFAVLDPLVRRHWYIHILEGRPIWNQPLARMVQTVLPAALGVYATLRLFLCSQGGQRQFAMEFGLLLAGSLAIGVLVTRFGAMACALATIPTGWLLALWLDRINLLRSPLAKLAGMLALLLALAPGMVVLGGQWALTRLDPAGSYTDPRFAHLLRNACGMPESLGLLETLPPSRIFAPLDLGPAILKQTRHSAIATGHHRAADAMHDVIQTFLDQPEAAEAIVRKHQARYVIACPDLSELSNYRKFNPDGLAARLMVGKSPAWLEPVPLPASAGTMRVWRVVAQPARNSIASPFMQ